MAITIRLSKEAEQKLDILSMVLNESKNSIIERILSEQFDVIVETPDFKAKLNKWVDAMNEVIKPLIRAMGLDELKGKESNG